MLQKSNEVQSLRGNSPEGKSKRALESMARFKNYDEVSLKR
jgi:hypothetical protein